MEENKETDILFSECLEYAKKQGQVSQIKLQLKFRLGYMRASRIMQQIEKVGILDKEYQGNYVQLRKVNS